MVCGRQKQKGESAKNSLPRGLGASVSVDWGVGQIATVLESSGGLFPIGTSDLPESFSPGAFQNTVLSILVTPRSKLELEGWDRWMVGG